MPRKSVIHVSALTTAKLSSKAKSAVRVLTYMSEAAKARLLILESINCDEVLVLLA